MLKFFKWLIALSMAIAVLSGGFALYTYFLVDYSLENLETALAATENSAADPSVYSPVVDGVYHNLVADVAMQEVTAENLDVKSLVMSEATSRSFRESVDRNGRHRALIYLNELTKYKKIDRNFALKFGDLLKARWQVFMRFLRSFSQYFKRKIETKQKKRTAAEETARFMMLSKAQKLEESKEYAKLSGLYRKYLSLYPDSADHGFVSLALADALIRENRYAEAERILKEVQSKYAGAVEAGIAARGLSKIAHANSNIKLLDRLKTGEAISPPSERPAVRLKIAKTHISLYQFAEAEKILKSLSQASTDIPANIQYKALFYLGWIYKHEELYTAAEKIFLQLLKREGLPPELELGIRAELADVYYRVKDPEKALNQYQFLDKEKVNNIPFSEMWNSISSLEKANIFYYDYKDKKRAEESLKNIGSDFFQTMTKVMENQDFFGEQDSNDLRARAFRALKRRQVGLALELFNRHLISNPNDAWAQAGIATVYLLMGDLKEAEKHIEKAYQLQGDEYTAALVGYVQGIYGNYPSAIAMYKTALKTNPQYLSAQFNLACMYIKTKEYDSAMAMLEEIERIYGDNPPLLHAKVLNNMGYVLWRKGDLERAVEKFRRADKIEPDYVIPGKNLKALLETIQNKA